MSNNKKQSGGLSSWIFPLFMLMVFPPLGVILLVFKVLEGSKNTKQGRHPYYAQKQTKNSEPVGARTTTSATYQERPLSDLEKKGRKLATIGGILTALFGFTTLAVLPETFYWLIQGDLVWFLEDLVALLPLLCLTGGGLGCLWAGLRKKKQARKFRKYLAMVGRQTSVDLSTLSAAAGVSRKQVLADLEDMLDADLFPQGYLDYGRGRLVLSGDGLIDQAPKAAPKRSAEDAILSEIRQVNDAIANEKVSAQIDRIGVITARILDYQKSNPQKAPQLHSFLSYYLPTTLKILRAYGQLEAQGVAGENITAAMTRIEGMMDKVVDGFEKQLDQLFQGDAMDITTDVEVLERMLAKDGLAGQQGMTLGL